jgi:hypothetical protein
MSARPPALLLLACGLALGALADGTLFVARL